MIERIVSSLLWGTIVFAKILLALLGTTLLIAFFVLPVAYFAFTSNYLGMVCFIGVSVWTFCIIGAYLEEGDY